MKKNWEIKTLGEVGIVYNGNSINEKVKKDNYTNIEEGYPFIATKDIQVNSVIDYDNGVKIPFNEKHLFKIAPQNTPLICMEGGSAGRKIGYTNKEVCFGNKLLALIPKSKNYNSKYFYYFYFSGSFQKSFNQYLLGIIGGVSIKNFKEIPIPIPPIKEQEEIVERLDKGFELIDSLKGTAKKNLDNAKELFKSVLREELSPKEGWETKRLGEAGTTLTGQTPPTKDKDNFGNYIPFVKPADFFNGELNYLNEGLSEKGMKFSRVSKKGSTLMVCIGATIGKTAFTEIDVTSNQQINSIYPSKDFFPKFIYYYLISKDFYNQVIENASQATLPIINKSKWESLTISFPKSIKEQEEIVNRLDRIKGYCEELEGNYKRVLELCEELKQGLLREAFEVR